jgi:hypothetical protein
MSISPNYQGQGQYKIQAALAQILKLHIGPIFARFDQVMVVEINALPLILSAWRRSLAKTINV